MMPVNYYSDPNLPPAPIAVINATDGNADNHLSLHRAWEAWASQAEEGENRSQAVLIMKDCLERNATELSLRGLGLRTLPAQLPSVDD